VGDVRGHERRRCIHEKRGGARVDRGDERVVLECARELRTAVHDDDHEIAVLSEQGADLPRIGPCRHVDVGALGLCACDDFVVRELDLEWFE
jgi:hypothetical protein